MSSVWFWTFTGLLTVASATLYSPLKSAGFHQDVSQLLLGDHHSHRLTKRDAAGDLELFSVEKIRLAVANGDLSVLEKLDWALHNVIAPLNISSHCLTDIFTFFHNLYDMAKSAKTIAQCDVKDCECLDTRLKQARKYSWVLRVLDASPRIPSGILRGNFFLLGSYDVCTGLDVDVPLFGIGKPAISGKFCRADVVQTTSVPQTCPSEEDGLDNSTSKPYQVCKKGGYVFKLGFCFPDSCQSRDVKSILDVVIKKAESAMGREVPFCNLTVTCHERNLNIRDDKLALVVLLFICALFALILFGSLFDYFVYRQNMESAKKLALKVESDSQSDGHIPNDVENPKHHHHHQQQEQQQQQHYTNQQQHQQQQQQQKEVADQQYIQQQSHEHKPVDPHRKPTEPHTKPTEPFSESDFFEDQTTFAKILLAFSLYTNVKKLFDLERKEGQLFPVHGVRFLSLSWVILGHTYYWSIPVLDNLKKAYDLPKDFTNQTVLNASVCVDAFYLLGAMLVVYLFMKRMKKTNAREINKPGFWLMFYLHRYIRLTPVYLLIMAFDVALYRYMADGPFWNQNGIENNYCSRSWWTNAIYLNNFLRLDEQCMSWSWYLANDFQFYAFAPPFLILLWKNEKLGVAAISLTAIIMGVIRASIIMANNWPPTSIFSVDPKQFDFADDYWNQVYIKPYCRCQPYLVGMILGYIFYKTDAKKLKLPKWAVIVGWLCAFACCVGTLYGLFDYSRTGVLPNSVAGAVYAATQRLFWAAGVAWVIFACVTGNGGPVDRLLSWKFWMPLSRLTYCGYLVHPLIVHGLYTSRKVPLHFDSHLTMVYNFLGHVSLSYAVAFIFNLAFEVPILALEEMVFPTHGKKKKSKSQEEIVKSETIRTDPDGQHQQKQQVPLLSAQTSL